MDQEKNTALYAFSQITFRFYIRAIGEGKKTEYLRCISHICILLNKTTMKSMTLIALVLFYYLFLFF
jgi:hypothetical protein